MFPYVICCIGSYLILASAKVPQARDPEAQTFYLPHDMGKKRKNLSQAEIWDDSALVQSWDDALEEYKVCIFHLQLPIYC